MVVRNAEPRRKICAKNRSREVGPMNSDYRKSGKSGSTVPGRIPSQLVKIGPQTVIQLYFDMSHDLLSPRIVYTPGTQHILHVSSGQRRVLRVRLLFRILDCIAIIDSDVAQTLNRLSFEYCLCCHYHKSRCSCCLPVRERNGVRATAKTLVAACLACAI